MIEYDSHLSNHINQTIYPNSYLLYRGPQPRWDEPSSFLSSPDFDNAAIAFGEKLRVEPPTDNWEQADGLVILEDFQWLEERENELAAHLRRADLHHWLYIFNEQGKPVGCYFLPVRTARGTGHTLQLNVGYANTNLSCECIWFYDASAWDAWRTNVAARPNWWAGLEREAQQRHFQVRLNASNLQGINRPHTAWPRSDGWHLDCAYISDEQTLWWAVGELLFGPGVCTPNSVAKAALRLFKNSWPDQERRLFLDNLSGLALDDGVDELANLLRSQRYRVHLLESQDNQLQH